MALPVPLFCVIAVLANFVGSASAIRCYICNSSIDIACSEKFNPNLTPRDCDVEGATYCIKTTGIYSGIVGTTRWCSTHNLYTQCWDLWYPDHDRPYRGCIYACNQNDCNVSMRVEQSFFFILFLITFSLLLRRAQVIGS